MKEKYLNKKYCGIFVVGDFGTVRKGFVKRLELLEIR